MEHDDEGQVPEPVLEKQADRRRAFLKQAGTVAVAAPAVALLLSSGAKPAHATRSYTTSAFPP